MKKNSKEWVLFGVFILLFIFLSVLSPKNFLTIRNIRSMAFQIPEFGILAIAMMVVILTGGINLSLVTTGTLGGIISALVMSSLNDAGTPPAVAIGLAVVVSMAVSMLCGVLNGYVVSYIGAAWAVSVKGELYFRLSQCILLVWKWNGGRNTGAYDCFSGSCGGHICLFGEDGMGAEYLYGWKQPEGF